MTRNAWWVVRMSTMAVIVIAAPAALAAQSTPPAVQPWERTPVEQEAFRAQTAQEQQEHPTLTIGAHAPDFALRGTDDKMHRLADYKDSPVLAVVFMSNHCPASQMYEGRIKQIVSDYASKGVQVVAIAPNGPQAMTPSELNYSDLDDSFDSMVIHAEHRKFTFPYLYDGESQAVAHQYGPKVTPHIFIFDRNRALRYEGRIDDNARGNSINSNDTRDALDAVLAGQPVPVEHTPVFGCTTKWNSQIEGKKREMNEWLKRPVTLELTTADGLKKLRANPSGKTLMINFWATWCGPCVVEFPELITTYLWYRSREFEFISVSLNTPEERTSVMRFLEEQHSAVKNYLIDSEDVYAMQAAFDAKWESGVPFTIVIAPDGTELYRVEGEADILKLRRRILGILPDAGTYAGNTEYWRQ